MSKTYNLYNLEASFRNYLVAGNVSVSTIRSYLSDFRHFAGWITFYLDSHAVLNESLVRETFLENILRQEIISEYRNYLAENKLPLQTVNRRLSTIRKFSSFCISQGWIANNDAKKVANMVQKVSLIDQFDLYLHDNAFSESDITEIKKDVRELLVIS